MPNLFFLIAIQISQSGQNKVVLRDVRWDLSGKYRCEVSTDLPYFHTQVVGAHMHVVGELHLEVNFRID